MTTQRAIEIINPDNTMIKYTEQELRDACIMAIKALADKSNVQNTHVANLDIKRPKSAINPALSQLHNKFIGRKRG